MGWVGGGDNNIRYDIHHVTLSSPSYHHAIIMQSLIYAFHHTLTEIRREGMGWVGGWVGGIITFGTTYIMSLYHHHHIITQSSCHHHAISNLRISSYVDRDTQGGYGVGVFLLVYRLVESIYLLCLAVSRLKGV